MYKKNGKYYVGIIVFSASILIKAHILYDLYGINTHFLDLPKETQYIIAKKYIRKNSEVFFPLVIEHPTKTIPIDTKAVKAVFFRPTSDQFIAISDNNIIHIGSINTYCIMNSYTLPEPYTMLKAQLSSCGNYVALGCKSGYLLIYSLEKQAIDQIIQCGTEHITALAYNSANTQLAVGDWNGNVYTINLNSVKPVVQLVGNCNDLQYGLFNDTISVLCFADTDSTLIIGFGSKIAFWNQAASEPYETIKFESFPSSISYNSTTQQLVVGLFNGTTLLYDPQTKKRTLITKHTDNVNNCLWSPDKQYILSVSTDKTAHITHYKQTHCAVYLNNSAVLFDGTWNKEHNVILTAGETGSIEMWNITLLDDLDKYTQGQLTLDQLLFIQFLHDCSINTQKINLLTLKKAQLEELKGIFRSFTAQNQEYFKNHYASLFS
ncbi:WD40 repeat domain-containing protein [Candidatus Dependentiae bacterium]|nr:WD40 repeat domain-containing protein [Candidatus Dependentiae bacterium]